MTPYIIGHDHRISLGGKDAFQGEGLRRTFAIGADGVVAHDDHILDGSVTGNKQFAGQGEGAAVYVAPQVGTADMDKAVTHDTAQQIRHQVICARDSQFRIRSLVSHELDIRIQGAVGKGHISQFYRQDLERACFGKIRLVFHARHRQAGCKE